ncbi:MAG: hypothetical protein ABI667_09360 [Sphingomicrobium sp.]
MKKTSTQDGLIAYQNLSSANVPPDDAEMEVLEAFCLTVDGYQGERYSIDDLLHDAERIERGGLRRATLDELRGAAFIRQRQYRWSTDQGQTNEPLARKIHKIVIEIRRRVSV